MSAGGGERRFAPTGDLCNCEAAPELHGHGYPCPGKATAGRRVMAYVGEVCQACWDKTPPEYRTEGREAPGRRRARRRQRTERETRLAAARVRLAPYKMTVDESPSGSYVVQPTAAFVAEAGYADAKGLSYETRDLNDAVNSAIAMAAEMRGDDVAVYLR